LSSGRKEEKKVTHPPVHAKSQNLISKIRIGGEIGLMFLFLPLVMSFRKEVRELI
jgi:hypothetical protein